MQSTRTLAWLHFYIKEIYETGETEFISYRYEIKEVPKVIEDKAR